MVFGTPKKFLDFCLALKICTATPKNLQILIERWSA